MNPLPGISPIWRQRKTDWNQPEFEPSRHPQQNDADRDECGRINTDGSGNSEKDGNRRGEVSVDLPTCKRQLASVRPYFEADSTENLLDSMVIPWYSTNVWWSGGLSFGSGLQFRVKHITIASAAFTATLMAATYCYLFALALRSSRKLAGFPELVEQLDQVITEWNLKHNPKGVTAKKDLTNKCT